MLCSTSKTPSQLFMNMLLHILLLLLVLSLLFTFVVSKIMTRVFTSEINHAIDDALKGVEVPVEYKLALQKISLPSMRREDPVRRINNIWVSRMMVGVIVATILLLLAVVYTIYRSCKTIEFKQLMIENAITFLLVGIVEFIFFYYIVQKYIPIEPSMIKRYVMQSIVKL